MYAIRSYYDCRRTEESSSFQSTPIAPRFACPAPYQNSGFRSSASASRCPRGIAKRAEAYLKSTGLGDVAYSYNFV